MSVEAIAFYVSSTRVHVRCPLPEVLAALERVWGAAVRPPVETREEHVIEVDVDPVLGTHVLLDGAVASQVKERADVLAETERVLYAALASFFPPEHVLLHAASVLVGAYVVVLIGPSGAGKSSFALAALDRGHLYLADELTVTDGRQLWGVPRAVQLEPRALDASLPERLSGLDREAYRLTLADGTEASVPLRSVRLGELASTPQPVSRVCLVRLERARNGDRDQRFPRIAPLSALAGLAELHEAAFAPPRIDLGGLVGNERAYSLAWHEDPHAALEQLEHVLAARRSIAP